MPCYATGSALGDAQLSAEENWRDATAATRAACEMARMLRSGKPNFDGLSKATRSWVREHDKVDRECRKREKAEAAERREAKAALSKLTKRERELLRVTGRWPD